MNMFIRLFVLSISFTSFSFAQLPENIRFLSDFETGAIQSKDAPHDGWLIQAMDYSYTLNVLPEGDMSSPKPRGGNYSARFELHPGDNPLQGNYSPRVQLRQKANPMWKSRGYYIDFSVYIPTDWDTKGHETHITQIFSESDKGVNGATWGPQHKLVISANETWQVKAAYVSDPLASSRSAGITHITSNGLGQSNNYSLEKGKWTDFTYYVNFNLATGGTKVWKDGELIVDYTGPLGTPDGPFNFMLDIYGPVEKAAYLWFDEVKIMEEQYRDSPLLSPPLPPTLYIQ